MYIYKHHETTSIFMTKAFKYIKSIFSYDVSQSSFEI